MHKLLAVLMALGTLPALAAPRTVVLSVPGMTCAACPITVKKALARVPGVAKTEIDFDQRRATVTYDDARASVSALTKAIGEAGYPATPVDAK